MLNHNLYILQIITDIIFKLIFKYNGENILHILLYYVIFILFLELLSSLQIQFEN